MTFSSEGRLSVPGGRAWYGIAGSGARAPLLVVHGGPGAGHDYLEPLERLAGTDPSTRSGGPPRRSRPG